MLMVETVAANVDHGCERNFYLAAGRGNARKPCVQKVSNLKTAFELRR